MITYRTEILDEGRSIAFVYDESNRALTYQRNPDGTEISYVYDAAGTLVEKTLARRIVVDYSHDVWNNITCISYSDTTPSIEFLYDTMGRLISTVDNLGISTFAWDAFGQCTNEATSISKTERRYDSFGRLVEHVHSSGTVSTNVYDDASARLAATSFDGIEFVYCYLAGTDLCEKLVSAGIEKVVHYEDKRDLSSEIVYSNSDLVVSRTYGYDAIGNVISRDQSRRGGIDRSDYFSYDTRNQLTNAVIGTLSYSYDYDDIGNRKHSTGPDTDVCYQINNLDQYSSISNVTCVWGSPSYDVDGNQTTVKTMSGEWAIVYNGDNRPVSWSCGTTNIFFSYDWMGRRMKKTIAKDGVVCSESMFSYDGSRIVAEYAIVGVKTSLVSRTLWDFTKSVTPQPLAMRNAQNQFFYYTVDITKNVCEIISSNGELLQTYDYSPFGGLIAANGGFENSTLWASELYEKDIGLYSYLKRDYDSTIGRWLSKDPFVLDGYNYYIYVNNNPISKIDALGLAIAKSDCEEAKESILGGEMSNWFGGIRAAKLISEIENDNNCQLPQIKCECCNDFNAAGFFSGNSRDGTGSITLCDDKIISKSEVQNVIVHELTHAYDSCKGTDFSDCEQRACSEIRATKLSRDCQCGGRQRRHTLGLMNLRGFRGVYWEPEEECIKRTAKESTSMDLKCIWKIDEYVDSAYKKCANSNEPID